MDQEPNLLSDEPQWFKDRKKWGLAFVVFLVLAGILGGKVNPKPLNASEARSKCYDMFYDRWSSSISMNSIRTAVVDEQVDHFFVFSNFGEPVVGYMKCEVYKNNTGNNITVTYY